MKPDWNVAGKWTGLVTTTHLTDATPGAAFSHAADRDWETDQAIPQLQRSACPHLKDIAYQLVHQEPNQYIRVGQPLKIWSRFRIDANDFNKE